MDANIRKYSELLVSVRKVIRAVDVYSKQLSKETGLTSPQLLLLQKIAANDGVMVKQIASFTDLSSATVTSILDRLEARDFVVRERSTVDKRKVGLHITPQGMNAIAHSPIPLQKKFIREFESLDKRQQQNIISAVSHLAKMMSQ